MIRLLIKTSVFTFLFLFSFPAFAAGGGVVKGTFKHYNRLIHYCPSVTESRDCTGSNYNEDAHEAYVPVSDMKFRMRVDGTVVANFATDANGEYQFSWSYPHSGTPTNAQIEGYLEHKDGRFQVLKEDGSTHRIYTNFTASYDWTGSPTNATGSVQDLGTRYWGTIERLITYHAAWRTWYYAFNYSGVLRNNFGTMDFWVGSTTGNGSYDPINHRGNVPAWEMNRYSYQVVYHEMGHAASLKSSRDATFVAPVNCQYPTSTAPGGSHNYNTPEWSGCSFEEGFVDFVGLVGQYWYNAVEARACTNFGSSDPDYCENTVAAGSGVELEPNPACTGTDEDRLQRNTTTFLWDVYDTANEGSSSTGGDWHDDPYYHFFDANQDLLNSTGTNGKNEPWNSSLTSIDEADGRSLSDHRHMHWNMFSRSTYTLFQDHCSPPGDW